jgi:hypothetical protein
MEHSLRYWFVVTGFGTVAFTLVIWAICGLKYLGTRKVAIQTKIHAPIGEVRFNRHDILVGVPAVAFFMAMLMATLVVLGLGR